MEAAMIPNGTMRGRYPGQAAILRRSVSTRALKTQDYEIDFEHAHLGKKSY